MEQYFLQHPIVHAVAFALVGAVLVDIHAWSASDQPFNWKKAAKRWVGTVTTALALSLGIQGLS